MTNNLKSKLTEFNLDDQTVAIDFIETTKVKDGVECDVYSIVNDRTKDLAIISVDKESKTPLQRILSGKKTIEGYVSGEGTLTVTKPNRENKVYKFKSGELNKPVEVKIGEIMQWHADGNSNLTFYELCEPPYQDGRFENQ